MAKTIKENVAPEKEVATQQKTNEVVPFGETIVSKKEAAEKLKSMKVGDLDSGYAEFQPGEVKRVLFVGWKDIPKIGTKTGETVPAVVLLFDNGKEQINADAAMVSYFNKQTVGCARQISCTGEKTTPNGSYKTFKFHELNM